MFGLRDRGWGGYEVKKKFVYLTGPALYSQFRFSPEDLFFGFGLGVGLAWGPWASCGRAEKGAAHRLTSFLF